ncbi:hypothetical protein MMC07_005440 [Pseudocyphellaria aurata]|nr:hypothetical protein [Pseudocyphellaria aurata]
MLTQRRSQDYGTAVARSKSCYSVVDISTALTDSLAIPKPLFTSSPVRPIAPRTAFNNSLSESSSLHQPSQWSPSAIGTIFFGCVTSISGIAAVMVKCYLNRRHARRVLSDEPVELDDTSTSGTPHNGGTQPLQGPTPSQTSINGASTSVNQDG